MKKIKLIIADMDGTLLDDNHRLNDEIWDVLEEMKKNNILFSVASGRQYHNLLSNFESVRDDVLFIAENGSYVVYRGREMFSNIMDRKSVEKIVEKVKKRPGISITLCGKKSAYVDINDTYFFPVVEKYYDRVSRVEDLMAVDDDILKISICEHKGVSESTVDYLKDEENSYKVTVSTGIWIDLANTTANKGEAVEFVQEKLDISREHTAVFGDYLNDIEMIKNAGHSFAMKNAHPEVRKLAGCTVGSNNENGVVEKIKEILSQQTVS